MIPLEAAVAFGVHGYLIKCQGNVTTTTLQELQGLLPLTHVLSSSCGLEEKARPFDKILQLHQQ
jgi:hypothetical protein